MRPPPQALALLVMDSDLRLIYFRLVMVVLTHVSTLRELQLTSMLMPTWSSVMPTHWPAVNTGGVIVYEEAEHASP